jgi:hypothetical protein
MTITESSDEFPAVALSEDKPLGLPGLSLSRLAD